MSTWSRADIEMAIAIKRAELNAVLSYKTAYNAEAHNICLALVRYRDGSFDTLAAYSNDAAIPESLRLGLNLVPNLYAALPSGARFGCDGMAQYHTEPKLLNFLCAPAPTRQAAISNWTPSNQFYREVLDNQRKHAKAQAVRLGRSSEIASVVLVTEIDCCPTCTAYSVNRFRARYANVPLETVELGKKVAGGVGPQFQKVKITVT